MSDMDWKELERAAATGVIRSPEPTSGSLWFSMRGRIPRSTYWLKFGLPIVGLQLLATAVDATLGTLSPGSGMGAFSTLTWLALLYPGLVGAVKRLHDLDYPGWYLAVLYGGVFGMGMALAVAAPLIGEAALFLLIPGLALLVGSIVLSVKMGFVKGTVGPNRYGADPLQQRWS